MISLPIYLQYVIFQIISFSRGIRCPEIQGSSIYLYAARDIFRQRKRQILR